MGVLAGDEARKKRDRRRRRKTENRKTKPNRMKK